MFWEERLKKFEYLWINPDPDTSLLQIDPGGDNYLIQTKERNLFIESPNLARLVVEQMRKAGIKIIPYEEWSELSKIEAWEAGIKRFKSMWTHEAKECRLVEIKLGDLGATEYLIFDARTQMVNIYGADLYEYVIEQMKTAGVKIISPQMLIEELIQIAGENHKQHQRKI